MNRIERIGEQSMSSKYDVERLNLMIQLLKEQESEHKR